MRTIKFKAKRVDNGEWVFGSLIQTTNPHKAENEYWAAFIHEGPNISTPVPVIRETVCQFTGILDKSGVEIYERDIVDLITNWVSDLAPDRPPTKSTNVVEFVDGSFQMGHGGLFSNGFIKRGLLEVTGNIHDK